MITKELAVTLLQIRLQGMLAHMFSIRGVTPDGREMRMIKGEEEITARDIGEIAYTLDFHVTVGFAPQQTENEE